MKLVFGVDPGFKGGIAVFLHGTLQRVIAMPIFNHKVGTKKKKNQRVINLKVLKRFILEQLKEYAC